MQKSDQAQKAHNDKMMLLVTIASVIVAAVASYAGMRTVSEARQGRIEAKQAAENSYALQKQTFDIEERPFLAIDIKGLTPAPQPRLGLGNFEISLVAFGKTPARNVHFVCAVQPNSGDVTPWKQLPKLDFEFKFAYILPSRSEIVGCQSFSNPKLTMKTVRKITSSSVSPTIVTTLDIHTSLRYALPSSNQPSFQRKYCNAKRTSKCQN
jgi:hypothetical protein